MIPIQNKGVVSFSQSRMPCPVNLITTGVYSRGQSSQPTSNSVMSYTANEHLLASHKVRLFLSAVGVVYMSVGYLRTSFVRNSMMWSTTSNTFFSKSNLSVFSGSFGTTIETHVLSPDVGHKEVQDR